MERDASLPLGAVTLPLAACGSAQENCWRVGDPILALVVSSSRLSLHRLLLDVIRRDGRRFIKLLATLHSISHLDGAVRSKLIGSNGHLHG